MKKALSIFVVTAMMLSMFLLAAPIQAKAAENLMNWDFESGNLADVGTADGNDADGYYASGDVSIVPGGVNGSGYAMKISGANSGNGQWFWELKSDTDYTVTFYAKIENWGGAAYPNFGVNSYDGDAYQSLAEFSDQWKQFTIEFHTGANSNGACIYTWIFGEGAVDFYLDNVVLVEGRDTALLKNWDFEHNNHDLMFATQGYYASGNVSIVPGGSNGSAYALKISGANSGNGETFDGLKPNTQYEVHFDAKIENWGGAAYPNFGVNSYDGDAYVSTDSFTGEWASYCLNFTTGAASTSAKIYTWIFGSGDVDFYLDNVTIEEAGKIEEDDDDNPLKKWDFEDNDISVLGTADGNDADGYNAAGNLSVVADGANGSGYSLKISNADSGNGQWLFGLKSNTQYEVRFDAKIANWGGAAYPNFGVNGYDGDAYVSTDSFTGEWASYCLNFTTGAASTSAKVYTWIFGSGEVDFYIDNVTVNEVDTDPLKDWNFEHNDISRLGTADGSDADAYNAAGNLSIVPDGANGTAYALKISGANSGNGQWIYGLETNTEYVVTFWAKIENWGGAAYPNLGVQNYGGAALTVAAFTEQWEKYTITFCTDETTTCANIYTWIFGEGDVDFFIDELTVEPKKEAGKVEKWNLSLGGNIGVNFYTAIGDPANTQIRVSVAGESVTYQAAQCQQVDGLYAVSVNVAAAQMTDIISVELLVSGNVAWTGEYSVYQYAQYILADEKGEFDESTEALVKEMLNYGAKAQLYFNYNANNTVDAALIAGAGANAVSGASNTAVAGNVSGMKFVGTTLLFKTKTAVRFYYETENDISGYTFKLNGATVEPQSKDGKWYIELDSINPQDLDQVICVEVSDGTQTLTVTYSAMDYIVRMSQKGSAKLQDLLTALYNYHLAAK